MSESSRATYAKLALHKADDVVFGTFDATSVRYEYQSENVQMIQTHGGRQGIKGTRSQTAEGTRILSEIISGPITFEPTPIELSLLLELAMGSASGTAYTLTETLPKFGILLDRVAERFVYANCKISKLTIAGQESQPITATIEVEGETETKVATAFPGTIPAIDAGQPYIFSDTTFSLSADASANEVKQFSIMLDNGLDTGRLMNSVTRGCIPEDDRIVTLGMQVPYNANSIDLHDQSVAGAAGTLTLTNGSASTLFSFANLKSPAKSPVTSRRGDEIMHDLAMQSYQSGSTKELVVAHDES